MRKIRSQLIGLTFAAFLAPLRHADAVTNYTDMWFNPSESGWGVNFTQDYNGPIFATFFVYDSNGAPTWVFGVLTLDPATGVYSGVLDETSGGTSLTTQSFNPATVQVSILGTVSFTPTDAANGTLAYTYRGSSAIKQITREPLYTAETASNATFLSFTSGGTAFAALFESRNNGQCSASYQPHKTVGTTWRIFPTAVTNNSISFNLGDCDPNAPGECVISNPVCTFTGAIIQTGRLLSVPGTLDCAEGRGLAGGLTGTLTATFSEIEHTDAGVNGKLFVTNGSCNVQSIVLIQRNDWLSRQLP